MIIISIKGIQCYAIVGFDSQKTKSSRTPRTPATRSIKPNQQKKQKKVTTTRSDPDILRTTDSAMADLQLFSSDTTWNVQWVSEKQDNAVQARSDVAHDRQVVEWCDHVCFVHCGKKMECVASQHRTEWHYRNHVKECELFNDAIISVIAVHLIQRCKGENGAFSIQTIA